MRREDREEEARRAGAGVERRRVTVCGKSRALWSKRAPIVAMRGQWLSEAGFPIGTRVSVEVEPKRLVLTAVGHAAQGD